jgi:cell division protease FtsH
MADRNSRTQAPPRGRPAPPPPSAKPPREGGDAPGWRVQPAPDGRGAPPPAKAPRMPRFGWRFVLLILGLFALNFWLSTLFEQKPARVRIPYTPTFLEQVQKGNVKAISSKGSAVQGDFKADFAYPPDAKKSKSYRRFSTEVPAFANTDALSNLLQQKGVEVNAKPVDSGRSLLGSILIGFGPTLLFIGLLFVLMRRATAGMGGGIAGIGRSQARRADEGSVQRVTFEDVAGIDEAEDELVEIVDFLRNPEKYQRLGGRIPRGVLLSGPPGTGKTLLARAVAGEAGVPFFSISASEFVEMIVGVGASRVRDLFKQAKEAGPAIIFIDELDAIGRRRSAGMAGFGGNDEREQTLNQILTEMDGFDASTEVIVVAATNRPEVLDPALLRPGRFDRRVAVQPPDKDGRRKILDVHTRSLPLDDSVDLDRVAASTPGMVGADLANLCNEAALTAARRGHERVQPEDFSDAMERIVLGAERKVVMTELDRERTAYHEAGHAIVGMLTPGADPVRKVSIIPRGMALGVTLATPENDRFNYSEDELRSRIKVALGGRVAEEIVYGSITTGAESDLQQLTQVARHMVGRWGMSPAIGPVTVESSDGQGPLLPGAGEVSEHTQRVVDEEVRRIVDEAYAEVRALLGEHRERLEALTRRLLEEETLDEVEAYAAAGIARDAVQTPA